MNWIKNKIDSELKVSLLIDGIKEIIQYIDILRKNIYPSDWKYDKLLEVKNKLEKLIKDM